MQIVLKELLLALLFICIEAQAKSLPQLVNPTLESNQYVLKIILPGGSERVERTEIKNQGTADEELVIKGSIREVFTDPKAKSITIYEAGKKGYIVRYHYEKSEGDVVLFLSQQALKSAAG